MRFSALLVVLLGCAAQAQPLTLDRELAEATLGIGSADDVAAGVMPDSLRAFLPEGAQVLGTIRRAPPKADDFFAMGSTVYARVDAAPEAAARAFAARAFPGYRSWEALREEKTSGFTRSLEPRLFSMLYSEDEGGAVVSVRFSSRSRGGSFVSLSAREPFPIERGSQEVASGEHDAFRAQMDDLSSSLPLLEPPTGAVQNPRGGGGSNDHQTEKATLTTDLPVSSILAHYGALMTAGGWTPFGETTSETQGASGWTRVRDGVRLAALFQVSRIDGSEYVLSVLVNNGDES